MGKDKGMPPGPSRRADLLTEDEQRQLRQRQAEIAAEDEQGTSQAEGEAQGNSSAKVGKTPGQSEGERRTVEEELERRDRDE
jgi:hypothetical protein